MRMETILLERLRGWNAIEKTTMHEGERGICFSWPCIQSFCEIMDDKIELYIGSGEGFGQENYTTILEVYTNIHIFCNRIEELLVK